VGGGGILEDMGYERRRYNAIFSSLSNRQTKDKVNIDRQFVKMRWWLTDEEIIQKLEQLKDSLTTHTHNGTQTYLSRAKNNDSCARNTQTRMLMATLETQKSDVVMKKIRDQYSNYILLWNEEKLFIDGQIRVNIPKYQHVMMKVLEKILGFENDIEGKKLQNNKCPFGDPEFWWSKWNVLNPI